MAKGGKTPEQKDAASDKKAGIKDGSPKDTASDKKAGIKPDLKGIAPKNPSSMGTKKK